MLIFFILLSIVLAEPITGAELVQQYIPQLEGDIRSEQAKMTAREQYFAGEEYYGQAFLELQNAPLLSFSFLRSRLIVLQQRSTEREQLRFHQLDLAAEPEIIEQYEQQLEFYLSLQTQNQSLEERLLHSLLMQLESHPGLSEKLFDDNINSWISERETLDVEEKNLQRLAQINEQEQGLRQLKGILVSSLSVIASTELEDQINKELQLRDTELSELERRGSIQRIEIISIIRSTPELEFFLQTLKEKDRASQISLLQEELAEIKENWSVQEWDKEAVKATKNMLLVQKKSLSSDDPLDQIRLEINQYKLERIQIAFNKQELEDKKVQKEFLNSQKKLSEAKKLQQQGAEKDQQIQAFTVAIREEETAIRKEESIRRQQITEFIATSKKTLQEHKQKSIEALNKPPMDLDRQQLIDDSYFIWHSLILSIQQEIKKNQSTYQEMKQENKNRMPKLEILQEQYSSVENREEALRAAIVDLEKAFEDRSANISNEELALIAILVQAKKQRKNLQVEASKEIKQSLRKDFWVEMISELEEVRLGFQYRWNELKISVFSASWHFEIIAKYFKRLVVLIVLLSLWRTLRGKIYDVFRTIQNKFRIKRLNMGTLGNLELWKNLEVDHSISEENYKIVLASIIDISVLLLYIQFFSKESMLVTFIVHLLVLILALRLSQPLVSILVREQELGEPLINGLQALVVCTLGFGILDFVLADILLADRSSELLNFTQNIVLWILLIYQLGVWSHLIEQYVMKMAGATKMKEWMKSWSKGIFGGRVKIQAISSRLVAIIGLFILLYRGIYFLLILLMENSEILGSALARRTLKSPSSKLDMPSQKLLDDFASTYKKEILFENEVEELEQLFVQWGADRKRGMVAIIGDHGSGKSQILRKLFSKWKRDQIVRKIKLEKRCTSPVELLALLSSQLQVEASNSRDMIYRLREVPSMVICIDDLQRCMLRDVGGYDAIHELLAIMQGTAHHHFWVATFHLHSWSFLHSASTPVNLSVFRKAVHIKPLQVAQVRDWIVERCKVANIQLDFTEISTMSNEESLRRAKLLFWRLLTDLSKGNPSVIEQFWLSSMRKGDTETMVNVVLFTIPDESILDSLTDTEAFILAYLLIHDDLSLPMLQRSLNIQLDLVQIACRKLLGLGLLIKKQNEYEIHDWWWPLIERFLVKKRMIYLD